MEQEYVFNGYLEPIVEASIRILDKVILKAAIDICDSVKEWSILRCILIFLKN